MTIQESTAIHDAPEHSDTLRALKDVTFGSVGDFSVWEGKTLSDVLDSFGLF